MFEAALIESRGLVSSKTQKWMALGSLTFQLVLAGLLLLLPLLRPEALLMTSAPAPHVVVPVLSRSPVQVQHVSTTPTTSSAVTAPSAPVEQTRPLVFSRPGESTDGNAPAVATNLPWGSGNTSPLGRLGAGTDSSTGPVVVREQAKRVPVSSGVVQGLLLRPIQPVYPAIAKATRIEGTVVINAVISKAGRIESLNVLSGPDMLRRPALDAVAQARYRPYLLNGEPVEVQTEIRVVFRLAS